jgi:hypothetical protein
MKQHRPKFNSMWKHFSTVHVSVPAVGKIIGGKVEKNIEIEFTKPGAGFANACAIRMSYCLQKSGIIISKGHWDTVSGGDKKLYIFRVADMKTFLGETFGKPDKTVFNPRESDFVGVKGILVFTQQFIGASGHATLWDGRLCSDHCYFPRSTKVELWQLK